jgi:glycosyltransferase involved in cell wall biosynthesis
MSLALLLETELAVDVAAGITTFGISASGQYVDRVQRIGVTHIPVPALTRAWNPRQDLRATHELATALRRLELDILHTHNPKTGILGRFLGRALRIPVVVNTCHGLWAQRGDRLLRRGAVLGLEAVAAQVSHAELYQNADDRHTLRWAVPARRAQVVGNGVNLDLFRRDPAAGRAMRERWGVGTDTLLVGGVGRRVAEKGITEFAAAAQVLNGRAEFVWIGPSDDEKADAIKSDLGSVRFVGAVEDMAAAYSALDVFVLPSYREGFSRSAMEAAACGTPMVLSDIRGCREIGIDGEQLLLTPPKDVEALVAAIRALLDDEALRTRFAVAAESRARHMFDQRAVAGTSLATYAAVANMRGLGWRCEGVG